VRELTGRQRKILDWVIAFRSKHGMPPTVREIGAHFGMASSSVFSHLKLIEKKGCIRRGRLGARSLEVPGASAVRASVSGGSDLSGREADAASVPVVGRVAAGAPLLAAENLDGVLQLDRAVLGRGPAGARHFGLKVTGDSMIEAGILDGDTVVARQQDCAENGQIVIALIDDEATVKRFYREPDRVRLQPANSRMAPIYAKEVAIQGVVVCVLRTYS